jgi:hypothetical protein
MHFRRLLRYRLLIGGYPVFLNHGTHRNESSHRYVIFPWFRGVPWLFVFTGSLFFGHKSVPRNGDPYPFSSLGLAPEFRKSGHAIEHGRTM